MNRFPTTDDTGPITESDPFAALPRAEARAGFEEAVWCRVAQRRRRRRLARGAAGGAALVAALIWLAPRPGLDENGFRARAEVAQRLEAQAASLEQELERLRGQAGRPPRLYLGGSERIDLFIELDDLAGVQHALAADGTSLDTLDPGVVPVRLER